MGQRHQPDLRRRSRLQHCHRHLRQDRGGRRDDPRREGALRAGTRQCLRHHLRLQPRLEQRQRDLGGPRFAGRHGPGRRLVADRPRGDRLRQPPPRRLGGGGDHRGRDQHLARPGHGLRLLRPVGRGIRPGQRGRLRFEHRQPDLRLLPVRVRDGAGGDGHLRGDRPARRDGVERDPLGDGDPGRHPGDPGRVDLVDRARDRGRVWVLQLHLRHRLGRWLPADLQRGVHRERAGGEMPWST